jgi:hypothetical protein
MGEKRREEEKQREVSRELDDTIRASMRMRVSIIDELSTLKLQLRHRRLSHAHLLNTDDLAPLAQPVPDSTMRVHLQCV